MERQSLLPLECYNIHNLSRPGNGEASDLCRNLGGDGGMGDKEGKCFRKQELANCV